jgi:hypothetical protein
MHVKNAQLMMMHFTEAKPHLTLGMKVVNNQKETAKMLHTSQYTCSAFISAALTSFMLLPWTVIASAMVWRARAAAASAGVLPSVWSAALPRSPLLCTNARWLGRGSKSSAR